MVLYIYAPIQTST